DHDRREEVGLDGRVREGERSAQIQVLMIDEEERCQAGEADDRQFACRRASLAGPEACQRIPSDRADLHKESGPPRHDARLPADITRWIYTTYMLVAAIFLVGLGGLALSIRRSFARQIRELEGRLQRGSSNPGYNALPPPLPETTSSRDHVDRDIDELLESLS